MAARGTHGIVKDGSHGHTDHADTRGCIRPVRDQSALLPGPRQLWKHVPFRGPPKHVVENLKHVAVISNLRRSRGVGLIRRFGWDLIPNLREIHVDSRVVLDHFFELAQDRDKLSLSVLIDVVDRPTQPRLMDAVVGRQPATQSGVCLVSILNLTQLTSSGRFTESHLLTLCIAGILP